MVNSKGKLQGYTLPRVRIENFGSEKILSLKKILSENNFGSEKNLGLKKFWF